MDYSLTLLRAPLFRGIPREDLPGLLEGLDAREHRYGRGEAVLRRGERADRMGLVLSGTLHIVKEDFWGSRTIVGLARPGEVFAESYACLEGEPLEVSVLAAEAAEALFLNSGRTLPDDLPGAAIFTRNLLTMLAGLVSVGLLLGWLLGGILTPVIVARLDGVSSVVSVSPVLFVGAALFAMDMVQTH